MIEWMVKYWLEVIFSFAVTLLGIGYRQLARKMKEQDAIRNGMQAILRDRIIQAYNHYLEKGFCPIYARQNIQSMYRSYTELEGNGIIPGLIEKLDEMPTEKIINQEG